MSDAHEARSIEQLYAALCHASPDAVIVIDAQGNIAYANAATTAIFGYEPAELYGQPLEMLVPQRFRRAHRIHRRHYAKQPQSRPMGSSLDLVGLKKDGTELPIDVGLAPLSTVASIPIWSADPSLRAPGRSHPPPFVAAYVRDATAWKRTQRLLESIGEITRAALAGATEDDLLAATTRAARDLANADLVAAVDADAYEPAPPGAGPGESLLAFAVSSSTGETKEGASQTSLSAVIEMIDRSSPHLAATARGPVIVETEQGPLLATTLPINDARRHVIVTARKQGALPFEPADADLLEHYAHRAAVALRLARNREELARLTIIGEQGRIARDLHDTVIQRLFATGMSIQSILPRLEGALRERVTQAVSELDATIAEIRTTIFGLQHASADAEQLRSRVLALAAEYAPHLGFRPRVAFDGPVDTMVDTEVADEVMKVLREALSNIARHAHASAADLVLSVTSTDVVLTVSDDGIGPPAHASAGNGLRNISARAQALGGSCELTARRSGGSQLEWRAHINPD